MRLHSFLAAIYIHFFIHVYVHLYTYICIINIVVLFFLSALANALKQES